MKNTSKAAYIKSLEFKGSHQEKILKAFKDNDRDLDVNELALITGLTIHQVWKRLSELERALKIKMIHSSSTFTRYVLVRQMSIPQAQEEYNLKTLKRGVRMLLRKKHLLSNTLIFELEKLNKIIK